MTVVRLTILGVLTGSIVLLADLIRATSVPLACGAESGSQLRRHPHLSW